MANTGNITVTERDMNPLSPTYNTTRTRTYTDARRCPLPSPEYNFRIGYTVTGSDYFTTQECSSDYTLTPTQRPYNIRTVVVGDCIHYIQSDTFAGITTLRSAVISGHVYSANGFNGCTEMTSLTLHYGIPAISASAFQSCRGLTELTIPESVTSIGDQAFYGCSGLTGIYVISATPPTLGLRAFDSTNDCPIYVPAESVDTYKAASGWSTYASRIFAIPS